MKIVQKGLYLLRCDPGEIKRRMVFLNVVGKIAITLVNTAHVVEISRILVMKCVKKELERQILPSLLERIAHIRVLDKENVLACPTAKPSAFSL